MFKQYIKHKNITALLTDCNIRQFIQKKISHRSSIGLGPTDTILICNRLWHLTFRRNYFQASMYYTIPHYRSTFKRRALLSQSCWSNVHFITRELVLASVAAFVKTPALPPNLIIHWI